jgi:hypothetical protein
MDQEEAVAGVVEHRGCDGRSWCSPSLVPAITVHCAAAAVRCTKTTSRPLLLRIDKLQIKAISCRYNLYLYI